MSNKIVFLLIAFLLISCSETEKKFDYEVRDISVNNITVSVEIADTTEKIMFGLMERGKLGRKEGMLFLFEDEIPRTFWMKNTLIPLDILFINSTFDIVKIQYATPCEKDPCPIYPSGKPAKYVLEVNKGFADKNNIEKGMKVKLNND